MKRANQILRKKRLKSRKRTDYNQKEMYLRECAEKKVKLSEKSLKMSKKLNNSKLAKEIKAEPTHHSHKPQEEGQGPKRAAKHSCLGGQVLQ